MRGSVPIVLLATVVLGACGAAGDGPDVAARQWFQAIVDQDGNAAARLTCDGQQDALMTGGIALMIVSMLGNEFIGASPDLDMSDLEFRTVREDGDTATVHVGGQLRAAILLISQPTDMDQDIPMIREDGRWKVCE